MTYGRTAAYAASAVLATVFTSAVATEPDFPVRLPPNVAPEVEWSDRSVPAAQPVFPGEPAPPPSDKNAVEPLPPVAWESDGALPGEAFAPPPQRRFLREFAYRKVFMPEFSGPKAFGMADISGRATLAVPGTPVDTPLLVTPMFTAHFLEGPKITDLPQHLYDAALEIGWTGPIAPAWGLDIAVAPSVYSDFNNHRRDAFRITGRGTATWSLSPQFQLVGGVLGLGRQDYPVLPVGGIVWLPTPDVRIEAVFPRPRVLRRFELPEVLQPFTRSRVGQWLGFHEGMEYWCFLNGELGGNTWAVRRAAGFEDRATYSDLRATLGAERRYFGRVTGRTEIGWVFNRSVSYAETGERFGLDDAFIMRSELVY